MVRALVNHYGAMRAALKALQDLARGGCVQGKFDTGMVC